MSRTDDLNSFFLYVEESQVFRRRGNAGTPKKFRRYLERVFAGVEIEGKEVLDIGAGTGVFSAYVALRGAQSVHALEPEAAGSHKEMSQKFQAMLKQLGIKNVTLEAKTIQQIAASTPPHDLILLHNCINHFDEAACSRLHFDPAAQSVFAQTFRSLNQLTRLGGQMLVAEATRHNAFDRIGLKSPLAPTIDWNVHQSPDVWIRLAEAAGFKCEGLRWTPFSHFGLWCQGLLNNRIAAFFLLGHFSIVFRKVNEVDGSCQQV